MGSPKRQDWTTSAAKWVVVLVLGSASIWGIVWTIQTRPAPITLRQVDDRTTLDGASRPNELNGKSDGGTRIRESEAVGVQPHNEPDLQTPKGSTPRLININTATAAELELLPQIGPTLAGRIVADRDANGRFASLDDLERVRGIGPKTIEKISDLAIAN